MQWRAASSKPVKFEVLNVMDREKNIKTNQVSKENKRTVSGFKNVFLKNTLSL